MVAAYKEAIKPRVPNGELEIIPLQILQMPSRVGWPLRNNCFTDDIANIPYIVTTIPFGFMKVTYQNRLFTGFAITWATQRVPHLEQDLLTLPEHLRLPQWFLVGSCCLFFSFLCCVMCTIVCLFIFFILIPGRIMVYKCPASTCLTVTSEPLIQISWNLT